MKRLHLIAAVLGFVALVPCRAEASSLTLNMSGIFGPLTTLDGTALGAQPTFTLAAVFDSTSGIPFENYTGIELFPTVVTFSITGFGTYTSVPGSDVYVGLADRTDGNGFYEAVLTDSTGSIGFGASYFTATPSFSVLAPAPTVFSSFFFDNPFGPFTVPLQEGAGGLVLSSDNNGSVSFDATASITGSSVPEPSTLALSTIGLVLVGLVTRRCRRALVA